MQPGERTTQFNDPADIELHLILGAGCADDAVLDYAFDDGPSYCYERGERGVVRLRATRSGDALTLYVQVMQSLAPDTWTFSGKPLAVARGDAVVI